MNWFDKIKKFYDQGLWTKEMVADGIRVGKITEAQYEEIVDEQYQR